ncbi:MAG: VWA domain-containing protein [Roseovarius sp.]|nr:VWA domain-containing protein [Roseovarius sp.]
MKATRFPSRAKGVADRITGFTGHLRMNGLPVGPSETADSLAALSHINAVSPGEVRLALKTLLAPNMDIWNRFDDLFDSYWYNAGSKRQGKANEHVRVQSARPVLWQNHFENVSRSGENSDQSAPDSGEGDSEGMDGRLIATKTESLAKRDLRELTDEETLKEAEAAAYRLARSIRDCHSRRRKRSNNGVQLDLRRINRASLARGGEPIDLFRREHPDRQMRIVAISDVSGSMNVYSRVFLAFVKGLVRSDRSTEAFLFHTRLMRVTPAMRDGDSLRWAGRLSLMADGFGGGTDIGTALTTFSEQYGKALTGRTMLLILSDGYCSGTPQRLAKALSRIRKKARKIVWLNPLLGWKGYAPVAAAIQAALPYLDAHLSASTIDALGALEAEFSNI